MKVEIIAEAGINHDGKLDVALAMIDVAQDAGADTFKIQTSVPELEATEAAPLAGYQATRVEQKSQLQMIRDNMLSFAETKAVARRCEERGIAFLSTPADPISLKFLVEECGLMRIKIGSDNLTNAELLERFWSMPRMMDVMLSTGMATMDEISFALQYLERNIVTLMQCTSLYPTPNHLANVAALIRFHDVYGFRVGFSDHTDGDLAALIAVGAGASIIEKHFTLNRFSPGPDHLMSFTPSMFRGYVAMIRSAEQIMGEADKKPAPEEAEVAKVVRKSIVAARPIQAGEPYSRQNLAVKRPGTGVSPVEWDWIVNGATFANRDYAADEMIDPPKLLIRRQAWLDK